MLCLRVCSHSRITRGELETGKRITTNITWDDVQGAHHYVVYKRKGMSGWQSISLFDFEDKEPVKVLNAYPSRYKDDKAGPTLANFTYANGRKARVEKSSALKVWMEGGVIDGETFENFGKNLRTDGQSIQVDIITGNESPVTDIYASKCRRATMEFTKEAGDAYDNFADVKISPVILNLFLLFTVVHLDIE